MTSSLLTHWLLSAVTLALVACARCQGEQFAYESGAAAYCEQFESGMLLSVGWGEDASRPGGCEASPAFQLTIRRRNGGSATLDGPWRLASHDEERLDQDRVRHSVELVNDSEQVRVRVHTECDGTGVLKRWLTIDNKGKESFALTNVTVWSGLLWKTGSQFKLGHSLRSDNGYEGWFGWTDLKPGANQLEEKQGLAYDDPYFVLQNPEDESYFFGQLAWPVNYAMTFDLAEDQGVRFQCGPASNEAALRVVRPGAPVDTPAVHLGFSQGDLDAAVQMMHQHIRRSVLPPRKQEHRYRIQCIMPEDRQATYKGAAYTADAVKKTMDVAAAAGIEAFIVDGPTWAVGFGDWRARPEVFPQGLAPLREHAHQLGMALGLYAEPEAGRGDWTATKAFRERPEWFEAKVLNLADPAACRYMEHEWRGILDRYEIDLYRHDINVVGQGDGLIEDVDGFKESAYWRHYDALHDLTNRMQQAYPEVIFQQASGGGTRLDLSTLEVWDEHFTSDENRYPHVYRMAAGLSVFLPPEVLVTPNGMYPPHRTPDLVTTLRGAYALGNTPMFFNEVFPSELGAFDEPSRRLCERYAKLYREFMRPMLPEVKVFHHAPVNAQGGVESGNWFAMEFASPDKRRGWATVIPLATGQDRYLLRLRGVDEARRYRITLDNSGKTFDSPGADLRASGIELTFSAGDATVRTQEKHPASELVLLEAVD
jgi:alpha-galactosidase